MIGAIAVIVAMLLAPMGVFLTGAAVAALHGLLQTADAEDRFEGSELLPLS